MRVFEITGRIYKKVKTETIEISLDLENEVLGILGRSGCGKSVTLRCLAGILQPDKGKIQLDDKILFDSEKKISEKAKKRKIGYLFQNYALFPNMTVRENITFAFGKEKEKEFLEELLERFYLTEVAELYPSVLSGGQQQRTAMARMLAAKPDVILLDEPFSALDSFLRQEMEREVQQVLQSFGGVSILVSHNKEEIFSPDPEMYGHGARENCGNRGHKRNFCPSKDSGGQIVDTGRELMIYLDSAATSFHKPQEVAEAVYDAILHMGNSGRSGHEISLTSSRVIFGTRKNWQYFLAWMTLHGWFLRQILPKV